MTIAKTMIPSANTDLCIAGFGIRLGAFLADVLILALVGSCLALLFADYFASIGPWGRAVGFFIALTYFGVLDSRIGKGQTAGKAFLKLRVVDRQGNCLKLSRSVIRSAVSCLPYFLGGAAIERGTFQPWANSLLWTLLFGCGASIFYLYTFNRKTRQTLQDLVVDSIVVEEKFLQPNQFTGTVWRGHYIVLVVIFLATYGIYTTTSQLSALPNPSSAIALQKRLLKEKEFTFAEISQGGRWTKPNDKWEWKKEISSLVVKVWTTDEKFNESLQATSFDDFPNLAKYSELAKSNTAPLKEIILKNYPDASRYDTLTIYMFYGYDIGIANGGTTLAASYYLKRPETPIAARVHYSSIFDTFF